MTARLVAASRDASSYNRPNVRSPKRVHVANEVVEGRTPRPFLSARCSGAILDEFGMYADLADVPERARCQRRACARHWPGQA